MKKAKNREVEEEKDTKEEEEEEKEEEVKLKCTSFFNSLVRNIMES